MNSLTLSLSKGLAGTGVTCNGVMPGLTYTPMIDRFFADVAEQQGWPGDLDRARDHILQVELERERALDAGPAGQSQMAPGRDSQA